MNRLLVTPAELTAQLADPDWLVVDCRFQLADPEAGQGAYRASHVAGSVYAHLDRDLCGPIIPGHTGRHPLPDPAAFIRTLGGWGIDDRVRVVAYDDVGGALAAARLWWMLRWMGHTRVAVLDGGWGAWLAHGGAVRSGEERRAPRTFAGRADAGMVADADDVERVRTDPRWRLLDARTAERFRGENETIDPVAGRIPGARSAPYLANLGSDGRFRSPEELRAAYAPLIGGAHPDHVICYCGSGVTAAHDVFALECAGYPGARLYAGSWSDWILDPHRAVETG